MTGRVRDLLLVALTVSTGAVDAMSWMALGKVFSAFMTGNIVFLAFRTAGAAGPSVPRVLAAVLAFAAGAVVGARVAGPQRKAGPVWPVRVTYALGVALAAQAVFVAVWIGVGTHPSSAAGDVLIAVSALAMGIQTAAVFSLGVRAVFTTAATATWAVLMGDLSTWSSSRSERRRLAGVIVGLFAGAVAGAFLVLHARSWAPVLPLALSGLVVAGASLAARPALAGFLGSRRRRTLAGGRP
jgi:uncharacterized membrane protein YoaK (UPF0700 family)